MYFTVLHCTKLYSVLNFTVYCTVLYCTVLYCTVLCCAVLQYNALYCTVLYSTVLGSDIILNWSISVRACANYPLHRYLHQLNILCVRVHACVCVSLCVRFICTVCVSKYKWFTHRRKTFPSTYENYNSVFMSCCPCTNRIFIIWWRTQRN